MRRSWRSVLPIAVLLVVVAYAYVRQQHNALPVAPASVATGAAAHAAGSQGASLPAFLPPEATQTLSLIARGGPFPHRQDGTVFGNREHLLPGQPRGYYHEYTVATPGAGNRGARRIITGGDPPVVYYYTGDHYRSFREFTVPR